MMTNHALKTIDKEPLQNAVAAKENGSVGHVSESAAIFSIIAKLASEQTVDLERMERLIAMRDKEMERLARERYNNALASAQAEMPQVIADAQNSHTHSRYATYEAVSKAMQPVLQKYGFSLSFGEGKSELPDCLKIVCTVSLGAYEKHYEAHIPFDNGGMKGNANKNATQAFGSTITYGRRYLKTMIFDVAVKDQDDDAQTAAMGQTITTEQRDELLKLINETGTDIQKFCAYCHVSEIASIPASKYDELKQNLLAKKEHQQATRTANENH